MASKYLLKETLLPYSTKQRIAILVSLDNGCKMCVGVHKQLARVLGMDEAEIEEISLGIDSLSCSDAEKTLLHFCIRAAKKDNYKILKEDIDHIKELGYLEGTEYIRYFYDCFRKFRVSIINASCTPQLSYLFWELLSVYSYIAFKSLGE